MVIVSIDESSFKQEGVQKRYWQPSSRTIKQVFNTAAKPSFNAVTLDREAFKDQTNMNGLVMEHENNMETPIEDTPVR